MLESIENYIKESKEKHNMFVKKNVSIIGSPLSSGQDVSGVELACDDLRRLGLHKIIEFLGWNCEDVGNIEFDEIKENEKNECAEKYEISSKEVLEKFQDINMNDDFKFKGNINNYYNNIKNIEIIGKFSEKLFYTMSNELKKKNFVLNIGGDHSIAYASILSSLHAYKNLGVVWIDAHGDINTPEISTSGNYHGMPLAHVLGFFRKRVPFFEWSEQFPRLKRENLAIIGIRDIDYYEKAILKKYNINYYTIFDIERFGIYNVVSTAINKIDQYEQYPIHVSLDIDSIDKMFAPGTGTIAKGGLTYREINLVMEFLANTKRVVSMDIVEYNPLLDEKEMPVHGDLPHISKDATKTGRLCLELIGRLLGNSII